MAAHRYWRATRFEAYATGDLELSALQLIAGGVRVDASATLTASAAPDVSGVLANLQDVDLTTFARWSAQAVPRLTIQWDFGASPQDVATLRPAGDSLARYPLFAQLQWSDDAVVWWTQETYMAMAWPGVGVLATLAVGAGDPFHASVRSLLRFEGANNSTVFTDDTGTSTPTVVGAPTITTADQPLFGVSAGRFTSAGGYVDLGNVAALTPGSVIKYMVEAYVRLETLNVFHTIITNSLTSVTGADTPNRVWFGVSNTNQLASRHHGVLMVSAPTLSIGVWYHVALIGFPQDNFVFLYLDGQNIASTNMGAQVGSALRYVGGQGANPLCGQMQSLRITMGENRFLGNIYRSALPLQVSREEFRVQQSPLRNTLQGRTDLATPPVMLLAPVPPVYGLMDLATPPVLRVQDGFADRVTGVLGTGRGRVRGTVKVTPNTPVNRRVRLIREVDGMVIREGTSDPLTGAYDFQFVDELQKWTVVSYDYETLFRAVIADNLTAELMP